MKKRAKKDVETVDENEMETDWRDNAYINVQFDIHRQEIPDTLGELQQVWDGDLGQIDMTRDRI